MASMPRGKRARTTDDDIGNAANSSKRLKSPEQRSTLYSAIEKHDWFTRTVEVDVRGTSDSSTFRIHQGMAWHLSPWLADKLKQQRGDADARCAMRAEPEVFKLFLQWAYTQRLEFRSDSVRRSMKGSPALSDGDGHIDVYMPMVHLWHLSDRLKTPGSANCAVDIMLQLAEEGVFPSWGTVRQVFHVSLRNRNLPLRKLMVHIWAWNKTIPEDQPYIEGFSEGLNRILKNINTALRKGCREEEIKPRAERFHLPPCEPKEWPPTNIDLTSDDED